jgi:hypothetical protein
MDEVPERTGREGEPSLELPSHLAALTERLALLEAENADLKIASAAQARMIARLAAAPPGPDEAARPVHADTRVGRQGALRNALGATTAVALLTGTVSKWTARPTEATSGTGPDGNLVMGSNAYNNSYNAVTRLTSVISGLYFTGRSVFEADAGPFQSTGSPNATGVAGGARGTGAGVFGADSLNTFAQTSGWPAGVSACVCGSAQGLGFVGVRGIARYDAGVWGKSDSYKGVHGESKYGIGVQGWSQDSATGVRGASRSGPTADYGGSGIGIDGRSGSGSGVQGISTTNAGIYGQSTNNAAVFGTSAYAGVYGTSSSIGVWGTTTTGTGVYGQATDPNGFAGQFAGRVYVSGSLTVVNGAKSAAVTRKDGTLGQMYCLESPESWFEDFGTEELEGGQTVVTLPADFDEVVKGDDYRVFLTAIGDTGFLYVSRKGPHRFEVRSHDGAAANGSFDYRVVARRADPAGGRLEKVTAPPAPRPGKAPRALSIDELPKPPADKPAEPPGRQRARHRPPRPLPARAASRSGVANHATPDLAELKPCVRPVDVPQLHEQADALAQLVLAIHEHVLNLRQDHPLAGAPEAGAGQALLQEQIRARHGQLRALRHRPDHHRHLATVDGVERLLHRLLAAHRLDGATPAAAPRGSSSTAHCRRPWLSASGPRPPTTNASTSRPSTARRPSSAARRPGSSTRIGSPSRRAGTCRRGSPTRRRLSRAGGTQPAVGRRASRRRSAAAGRRRASTVAGECGAPSRSPRARRPPADTPCNPGCGAHGRD